MIGRPPNQLQQYHLKCRRLPGAEDTVVVLKTGTTEIADKLPIHLATTFECYPNYMIFSDHRERFSNNDVLALEDVSSEITANHPDFELYHRLQRSGRLGLEPYRSSMTELQRYGNAENPGWKLDKWKFLPMVNRTLHEYPNMKWYVFVEADTYIIWSSLLRYLSRLDPTRPYYLGSQMYISDVVFAHGGSGFIISQPAMRQVVAHYATHKAELESFTSDHWAGDCVLGKAFTDSGVAFTDAWPIMQGDYPGIVPYARPDGRPVADLNKRVWCYPTVSYHHLSTQVIIDLWYFEQQLIKGETGTTALRHKDIFRQYILPRMAKTRANWDNESEDEQGVLSFLECRTRCEAAPGCRQFSVDSRGTCKTRSDPRLGKAANGMESGWIFDRMVDFERKMAKCSDEDWLT